MTNILCYSFAFFISFLLSTIIIRKGIPKLNMEEKENKQTPIVKGELKTGNIQNFPIFDFRSTGFWIGFCETIITFAFISRGEFGALAIIIGAKEFVRKEKIKENASYYLLGTFVNLSLAILFAILATTICK